MASNEHSKDERLHFRLNLTDLHILDQIRNLLERDVTSAAIIRQALLLYTQAELLSRDRPLAFFHRETNVMKTLRFAARPISGEALSSNAVDALQVRIDQKLAQRLNNILTASAEDVNRTDVIRASIGFLRDFLIKQRSGWEYGIEANAEFYPLPDSIQLTSLAKTRKKKIDPRTRDIELSVIPDSEVDKSSLLADVYQGVLTAESEDIIAPQDKQPKSFTLRDESYREVFGPFDRGTFVGMNAPFELEKQDPRVPKEVQISRFRSHEFDRSLYVFSNTAQQSLAEKFFKEIDEETNGSLRIRDRVLFVVQPSPRVREAVFFGETRKGAAVVGYQRAKRATQIRQQYGVNKTLADALKSFGAALMQGTVRRLSAPI
jgi:hypothetical protein